MTSLLLLILAQTVTPVRIVQPIDGGAPVSVQVWGTVTTVGGAAAPVVQGASRDGGTDWPVSAKLVAADATPIATAGAPLRVDPTGSTVQPISGTVTANAGTGTLAVSGPVTDAQLRASPVPVSGTVTVTDGSGPLTVDGTVAVTNANLDVALSTRLAEATFTGRWPAAGALSDNFANPTTTQVGAFTLLWDGATWDRAPGTSVDGALVNLGSNNDVTVTSGTLIATQATAANLNVTAAAGANLNTSLLSLESTQTAMSAKLPATLGQKAMAASMAVVLASDQSAVPASQSGTWTVTAAQATAANLNATVTDGSGALTVDGTVTANLAAGVNNIGDVDVLTLPAIPAGNNNIGDVDVATLPNVTVGTFPDNEPFNVAQINAVTPLMGNGITGTGSQRVTIASDNTAFSVNANAGTNLNTSALALSATQTDRTQKTQITDGTRDGTVKAASTAAVAADTAVVVAISPNNTVPSNVSQFGGTNVSTGTGTGGAGIPRVTISSDSSLAANQSVNVAQINAVTPLMGVGASGTGAQRTASLIHDGTTVAGVIVGTTALKTDMSSIAGTATVTGGVAGVQAVGGNVANAGAATANPVPVGGIFTTVPATLSTGQTATMQFTAAQNLKHDITTIAGTAPSTGAGAGGAGIMRVTVSNDSSLAANQSVNISQINAATPLMGTGATGTGSPRVTLATNSPGYSTANGTIAVDSQLEAMRAVAYGSSPTAVTAGNQGPQIGDLEGRPYVNIGHPRAISCTVTLTATSSTQITGCEVVASNSIYITSMSLCGDIANTTATPAILQSGTSTACTGPAILFSGYHPAVSCINQTFNPPIKATSAHGLCILDGTTGTKKATISGYVAP